MAAPKKTTVKKDLEKPLEDELVLPKKIVLNSPYGFYEDDGSLRYWNSNVSVENEEDIKILLERGADWSE
jgi:hypothetical protein